MHTSFCSYVLKMLLYSQICIYLNYILHNQQTMEAKVKNDGKCITVHITCSSTLDHNTLSFIVSLLLLLLYTV